MSIAALIEQAKRVYAVARLPCGDALLPPAHRGEVDSISDALELPVPEELREVYRVHGGQREISAGITGLFGEHRLITPAEVIEHYQIYLDCCLRDPLPLFPPPENEFGYWVPELLPFASWDAYDLCIHTTTGEVWEFIANAGLIRHYPSIAAVLREIITIVQSGGEPILGPLRGPP